MLIRGDAPAVQQGCICPHNHEPHEVPGISGAVVRTSPQCLLHGTRSKWPSRPATGESAGCSVHVSAPEGFRGRYGNGYD
jgi:hypothetical protein